DRAGGTSRTDDWFARWLRYALRHHHAELDHDDLAFRASGARRRAAVGARDGHARRVRTSGANLDDGYCHWSWLAPPGTGQRRGRPRDRGHDGHCDPGRIDYFYDPQSSRPPHARVALWTL